MLLKRGNREQADRHALRVHKLKLELERDMQRDLAPIFRRMVRDFKGMYGEHELIPDQGRYEAHVLEVITRYHKKTSEIFSRNIRGDLAKGIGLFEIKAGNDVEIDGEEHARISEEIGIAVAVMVAEESEKQTKIIIATNINQMRDAVRAERERLSAEEREIIDSAAVAAGAAIAITSKMNIRLPSIATQNIGMAESYSKQAEADALNASAAVIDGVKVGGKLLKQWNAILDNKTRPHHVTADARYMSKPISVDDNYLVDNEELKYPRDPNGSPGNIINCRCESQITI